MIQNLSDRKDKKFVKINCAAIPKDLIESELFGYERGAFTGAGSKRIGLIESANKGTVFLDEIGELPYDLQGKLLRFLQNSEIQRIGSNDTINVDVRVISATNKNLTDLSKENKFREDLYFRLSVISMNVPSLKDRKEDLPLLIDHFMDKYKTKLNILDKKLSPSAKDILIKYNYPGNIRELENIIQHAILFSPLNIIYPENLPILREKEEYKMVFPNFPVSLKDSLESFEKALLLKALEKNKGNKDRAAKDLMISGSLFRYKLKKYSI
ncbi:MAG: sigma-54 interaction domain-containing protein, partial [Spirochaetota bacterium]